MPEHGIALAVIGGHDGIEAGLMLMCECGWHVRLPAVTTADHVAELAGEHRGAA